MSLRKISKQDFCRDYLSGTQAAAAKALLPDGEHTISTWQATWQKLLNSPAA